MICKTAHLILAGTLLMLAQPSRAAAHARWKVFSFRDPAFLEFNGNSFTPLRGVDIAPGYTLKVGGEGGFAVDGTTGTNGSGRISLIGPGLLRVLAGDSSRAPLVLSLEYGDLYLNIPFGQPVILRVGDYLLQVEDAELYVEESLDRKTFKLRNIGSEIAIDKDLVIGTGESFFWNRDSDQPVRLRRPNIASDIEWLKNRHANNRHRYELTRKGEAVQAPADYYNVYLESFANIGVDKLTPTVAGNTFVQNMPHIGPTFRALLARPIGELDNPTRQDVLYRPSLRAGVLVQVLADTVQPMRGATFKGLFPGLGIFGGFSVQGFAIDIEMAFQNMLKLNGDRIYSSRRPIVIGGLASYRIDLESIAKSDVGLLLGVRYSYFPMKVADPNAAVTAGVNPKSFNLVTWAGVFGVSFLF